MAPFKNFQTVAAAPHVQGERETYRAMRKKGADQPALLSSRFGNGKSQRRCPPCQPGPGRAVVPSAGYAVEYDVRLPHPLYPFEALYENLRAFKLAQQYRIIRELSQGRHTKTFSTGGTSHKSIGGGGGGPKRFSSGFPGGRWLQSRRSCQLPEYGRRWWPQGWGAAEARPQTSVNSVIRFPSVPADQGQRTERRGASIRFTTVEGGATAASFLGGIPACFCASISTTAVS
jgi:hypothetical protein